MIGRVPVALLCILCWAAPMPALAAVEEATAKPRTYADPEGRFGFQLSGEWVKLPADAEKGIAGSFFLAEEAGGEKRVVVELIISFTRVEAPISLEDYVQAEDRRAMKTAGFERVGEQEGSVLGGCPALTNRYGFSRQTGPEELRHKVVHQWYAVKDKTVWGITLTALQRDQATLAEVERLIASSFQFSVPEGLREPSLETFKKVTVGGSAGGFSLSVPEAWEVHQSEDQGVFIRGPGEVVYAFAFPKGEGQGIPQDVAGRFLKERENLKELRVLSQGAGELGGASGYAVEYSGTAKSQRWRVRLVTSVQDETVFVLYCVVPEGGWRKSAGMLGQVERSFSVSTPEPKPEKIN